MKLTIKILLFCFIAIPSKSIFLIGCNGLEAGSPAREMNGIVVSSNASRKIDGEWARGEYKGLRMGESTFDDMIGILGMPQNYIPPNEIKISEQERRAEMNTTYTYQSTGEIEGSIYVEINLGTLKMSRVGIRPESMTKDHAIKLLGNDYKETKYAWDECVNDKDFVPIFESSSGTVALYEYRHRGIFFGLRDGVYVDEISYISEPPGQIRSSCGL